MDQVASNSGKIEKLEAAVTGIEKTVVVNSTKIDAMNQSLLEIKNNHLLHINDTLTTLSSTVVSNHTDMNQLITNKITEVYNKLNELRINDAKQEPTNSLVNKVVEYIILAVVAGGVAYLVSNK